jgi:hypothetical protein
MSQARNEQKQQQAQLQSVQCYNPEDCILSYLLFVIAIIIFSCNADGHMVTQNNSLDVAVYNSHCQQKYKTLVDLTIEFITMYFINEGYLESNLW